MTVQMRSMEGRCRNDCVRISKLENVHFQTGKIIKIIRWWSHQWETTEDPNMSAGSSLLLLSKTAVAKEFVRNICAKKDILVVNADL